MTEVPVRVRRRCVKKGHRWRQKVWGMVGMQVCTRWRCDAEREDPRALPPADYFANSEEDP